ncbi:AAA family ATPase [Mucilaginibacter segetis]|uniref:AAA family ATPase n=1 Tax=Mucilaginibacter segetis TaxID=2793071 RepID=A0A934PTV9_9SPHI|nr:AAA family ATPase [Mucilaginibacter segetis]MBK0379061.1 AAA family ATPase [Mucilaginibacter segetis]
MNRTYFEIPINHIRPDIINDIRRDVVRSNKKLKKAGLDPTIFADVEKSALLRVKPAGEWMRQEYGKNAPRMLFGDFWFEGELCILFADTNLGKSILAVQIGNSLAQGETMEPFANGIEPQTPVLYVDFELSSKQFESRYFDNRWGSYAFGLTFFRAEFNTEADNPVLYDNYHDHVNYALEHAIKETKARVLIIDNLTYMRSGTERSRDALPLMKQLKKLKNRYKLSVLALAHTPKRRSARPLTVNDLQGSKMIINFCDSAFAIGESTLVPGGRYLKQIKQRNAQKLYGADNVCLCHIEKDMNSLHYVFDSYDTEQTHLQTPEKRSREAIKEDVLKLKAEGKSYREISAELNIGLATISRILS